MDKKSNRTDLLAAGRKRLEQYRQKNSKVKDVKGKHGKSSSKSTSRADKSEQHDDDESAVLTSASAPMESFQLNDKAPQLYPDSESSQSAPQKSSEDSSLYEPLDGAVTVPVLDDNGDDKLLSVDAVDLSIEDPKEIKASSSSSKEMEKLPVYPTDDERSVLGIPVLEAANANSHPSAASSASRLCADKDSTTTAHGPVEVDVLKNEDQEVHGSGPTDGDRSVKLGQQEDSNLSVPLVESSMSSGESDAPCIVADGENDMKEAYVSLVSGSDGPAVSLMKLVDLIKGLSEDDFTFLINSRSLVNSNILPVETESSDVCGVLRDHMYVASISKEFFHLQLLEASEHEIDMDHKHKQLADEISLLTASLDDINERNKSLYAELTECRSELKAAICEKEDLQSQCHSTDAEAKELSSKVDELKIIIEESSRSFSKLSEELDCCKHQLANSLAENDRLIVSMGSITEEKNREIELKEQLLDEKLSKKLAGCRSSIDALEVEIASLNFSLAFVTDERTKLEEDTQFLSAKNEKLSFDLADCRCLMNTLEEENSKLDANLAELREGRRVIEEMNANLVHENERLSREVSVHDERLSEEHARILQLEDDLEQARLRHEQLTEENICLSSTLEIYKVKIAEVSSRDLNSPSLVGVEGTHNWGHPNVANAVQNIPKNTVTEVLSTVAAKPASDDSEERLPVGHLKRDIYDDFSGFFILKGHLEEAEQLLQDLEKRMEGMHSHSITLSRSIGRSAAPGISKLIQAFESKPLSSENESEASETAGDDLYVSAKHHAGSLELVLKAMYQDIVHASNFARVEREGCKSSSRSLEELLVNVESWKDCCTNMELHNIELEVQYEALKQHICSMEVKHIELMASYEALRGKENSLMTQNIQLAEKLMHYHARMCELFDQLDEVRRSSGEVASNVHSDLEELRNVVMEKICEVEGALASSYSVAAQVVEKLDAAMGSPIMQLNPANSSVVLGYNGQIMVSVNAACQMIKDLKESLEAASRENKTLCGNYEEMCIKFDALSGEKSLAVDLLQKVFADLNCLDSSLGHAEESDTQPEKWRCYDALDAGHFESIINRLSCVLDERQKLKELNNNLHSELLNRKNVEEVLKKRSFDSDLLLKLVKIVSDALKLTPAEMNSDEPSLLLLQSLLSLLIEKYKDADHHVRLLRDDLNSRIIELRELKGSVDSLSSFNFQQQNEIFVLKESLKHAKDAYDRTQDQLLLKATELEHCEQRFASIREKLSIAVAKGKGLIVQRDSLKQSLSETSIELERCSQELQLKEAKLNEVEHKLKAYSEAGERMEALESELSYIRNSATALRESFLLKDSALQRIEEMLEEIELPEHFHFGDIVEKVKYLMTTVPANSSLAADWEQRSSIGGGSLSDAVIAKTDSWKDDAQPSMNPVDNTSRQYDDLQKRLITLAEQNAMLEQSLIERNNLVQRWEGVLDRIDTPVQIRSMEPDERIQWLGTALSEADHHMSSLQQKVDNLENYCESIGADLEESERRVSELEFSLQKVTNERNDLEQSLIERNNLLQRWEELLDRIGTPLPVQSMKPEERIQWLGTALSEADYQMKSLQEKVDSLDTYCGSLNANLEESQTQISQLQFSLQVVNHERETLSADLAGLRSEHEQSLERTAQFKQLADDLKSEVDALQGKFTEKLESEKQIEGQMLKCRDLIIETYQSCQTESLLPDGSSPGESLEILIQRLVGEYLKFRTETHNHMETIGGQILPDHATDLDERRVVSVADVDTHEFGNTNPPDSKERDALVEEMQSAMVLRRELDVAVAELVSLKEERDEYMKRSQSLVNELEEVEKKKEVLQKQLDQEEQKSASLREKLNVAVKKGKSLVQHRDALKQSMEGLTAEIDNLKSELKTRDDSIAVFEQKIMDLSSQIQIVHVLESENTFLGNQLLETKQHLQEREHTLSLLLVKLDEINVDGELELNNPVKKLEEIQKVCSNLHVAVVSSEQETRKAKRAAELLLAELNEVQERNDNMQEDLAKAYNEISELSRQKDVAESAKFQVISRLQELSEESRSQRVEYDLLKSYVQKLERSFFDVSSVIADVFAKDIDLLHRLRANLESSVEAIGSDLQLPRISDVLMTWIADKKAYLATYSLRGSDVRDQPDDIGAHLSQLTRDTEQLKEQVHSDSMYLHEEAELLLKFIGNIHSEAISLKRSFNSVKAEYIHLESAGKKRDMECTIMHQCLSSLYEACCSSIMDIESRRAQVVGNGFPAEDIDSKFKALPLNDGGLNFSEQDLSTSKEHVKILGDRLLVAVREFVNLHTKSIESGHKEMRASISNLQKELQEKDMQKERMCMELVSQIKEAEATAKGYSSDLQTAKVQLHNLGKRLLLVEEERKSLENRVTDMQETQVATVELQDKVESLTGVITAKEQEIEVLMQALDEEENQMEVLKARVEELEIDLRRKNQDLEQAVAARAKALKKLSITVSKFDELHHMSEGLLSEIENLQTQLQERESEISFLRQEVTRCTNDALLASKTAKERNANELQDFLNWLKITFSQVIAQDVHSGDSSNHQNMEQKDHLKKSITSIISELEELRIAAQRKETLLQAERSRVEDLLRGKEALEASLRQMEAHLSSLVNAGESRQSSSEIVEVESVINNWVAPVASSTASQVRSLRKSNNEQVAIAIDTADASESGRIEYEDDDKVHGFKSLTTSKFVPKFTRPVSDMIDGLWVSCDRALMRQPGLRLGIMIYWAILHALLATFVV